MTGMAARDGRAERADDRGTGVEKTSISNARAV